VIGRKPIVRGQAAPNFSAEWKSARGLLGARTIEVKGDIAETGRQRWSTGLGPLWTPTGASDHYLRMIVAEVQANVYDLSSLRSDSVVLDCGANVGVFAR